MSTLQTKIQGIASQQPAMKIENRQGVIEYPGTGRIGISLGNQIRFRGRPGLVLLSDGSLLSPLAGKNVKVHLDTAEDRCGPADRLHLSASTRGEVRVKMIWCLYREQPVVAIKMTVTNESSRDIMLDRLICLRAFQPGDGFDGVFPAWPACRLLNQPFYWGNDDVHNDHIVSVPENETITTHWNTVIGTPDQISLAMGIGEPASAGTDISFRADGGRVGFEVSASLRVDAQLQRCLRLPAGQSFDLHRMILVAAETPNLALDRYADGVCRFMNWHLRFPPYTGLFTAYGNDPENVDPIKCSLSEDRLATLMNVVAKYLTPYGLDTIKTQFRGFSSSSPNGKRLDKKLTADEAKDSEKVKTLVSAIRDKGFAPDDYDSRQDFPHGIGWHVKQIAAQGYRPALVCRPFYNIKAGTQELDQAAADLFEMAVRDWGYRYLMFDFISGDYDSDNDTLTVEQGIHNRFKAVRERLGPDIFIEACMVWPGPVLGITDGYRPAGDWRGCKEEYLAPVFACRNHYHGRFFQCDGEFMDPALYPFIWAVADKIATLDRLRLWVGFNAMLGFSYLGGAALERVTPERWWFFQRGMPVQTGQATAVDLLRNNPPRHWIRQCSTPAGNFYLLGLFNWSQSESFVDSVKLQDWGLNADRDCLFFDFWAQEVYGPARTLPNWLAPFSSRVFQVTPVPNEPTLIGNTRHVTGQVGIEKWQWNGSEKVIAAAFQGAPESRERYWIWLPHNEGVATCEGADLEVIRPHLIRLEILFNKSGRKDIRIQLDNAILVP